MKIVKSVVMNCSSLFNCFKECCMDTAKQVFYAPTRHEATSKRSAHIASNCDRDLIVISFISIL